VSVDAKGKKVVDALQEAGALFMSHIVNPLHKSFATKETGLRAKQLISVMKVLAPATYAEKAEVDTKLKGSLAAVEGAFEDLRKLHEYLALTAVPAKLVTQATVDALKKQSSGAFKTELKLCYQHIDDADPKTIGA